MYVLGMTTSHFFHPVSVHIFLIRNATKGKIMITSSIQLVSWSHGRAVEKNDMYIK